MHFKLIIALVDDEKSEQIMDAARNAGATGALSDSKAAAYAMVDQQPRRLRDCRGLRPAAELHTLHKDASARG